MGQTAMYRSINKVDYPPFPASSIDKGENKADQASTQEARRFLHYQDIAAYSGIVSVKLVDRSSSGLPLPVSVSTSSRRCHQLSATTIYSASSRPGLKNFVAASQFLAQQACLTGHQRFVVSDIERLFGNLLNGQIPESLPDFYAIRDKLCSTDFPIDQCYQYEPKPHLRRKIQAACCNFRINFLESLSECVFYTPVDLQTGKTMHDWLDQNNFHKVLEVGAGRGWWAKAITSSADIPRVSVTATDLQTYGVDTKKVPDSSSSSESSQSSIISVFPVEKLDAHSAVERYAHEHDILFVLSPDSRDIFTALAKWPNNKPILIICEFQLDRKARQYDLEIQYDPVSNVVVPQLSLILPFFVSQAVIFLIQNPRITPLKNSSQ